MVTILAAVVLYMIGNLMPGGSTEAFFEHSSNAVHKKMYEKMKENEEASFVSSNLEGES